MIGSVIRRRNVETTAGYAYRSRGVAACPHPAVILKRREAQIEDDRPAEYGRALDGALVCKRRTLVGLAGHPGE